MRLKPATVALFCGIALCASASPQSRESSTSLRGENPRRETRTLTSDDRLSLIAAALESKVPRRSERDCSHLVHAIYERAGFPYSYASSDDLYRGIEGFERVKQPEPGDLIVWRGHAGIVIRPSRHIFFSFKHAGPGIDDYEAPYWRSRGRPRFYRYVKDDACTGCVLVHDRANGWK